MRKGFWLMLCALLLLTGCSSGGQVMDGDGMLNSYTQISQDEAKKMMSRDDGHVIVDVRRQDEYEAGHIPGAILIPNESIGAEKPEALPDLNQIILIYCRSGNRSKQASQKLFDMGYTNIYEFGGINTWTGEIVTDENGSNEAETPAPENSEESKEAARTDPEETAVKMLIEVNGQTLTATLAENSSAEAFVELLSEGPLTLELHDYSNFEKVGPLPQSLPTNDEPLDTDAGDLILYQGKNFVLYYDQNSWTFTKLGHVDDISKEDLKALLGEGNVTVVLSLKTE